MDTLIKNIKEDQWHYFKVQAAKEKVTLGAMFNRVVDNYKKKEKETAKQWNIIFSRKPLLTNAEAKNMHDATKEFRKEYGFEG
ncbi:hypothetical protein COV16_05325 [Candidatus Woesearchaeota archaeon CG10_big_fil_rev_8_21_14_0_10_34_8]|nr:MAG: hypothetical protein COV16_05325 [Candidatus Woesearchaeota archaeon CG10_big_fil_rev_8_21_14_0_10_34_8]